jgi:hypothetical protein
MSTSVRIGNIIDDLGKGGKRAERAKGSLGEIIGGYAQVPFIKPVSDIGRMGSSIWSSFKDSPTNVHPTQSYPMTILRGMAIASHLQETGMLANNPPVESLPGVSGVYTGIFHKHGIYTALDIKDAGGLETVVNTINKEIDSRNDNKSWDEKNDPHISAKQLQRAIQQYKANEESYSEGWIEGAISDHVQQRDKAMQEENP